MALKGKAAEQANRANVNIVFGDEDASFRSGLGNALAKEGYKGIRDCRNLTQVAEAFTVETDLPDLLVLDAQMGDGKAPDLVARIRRGELGHNPFVTIIVTLREPDRELVEKVIACGVDDLLLKPISTTQIMDRIRKLASERQRFVVTTGYIGPQRRRARRDDDAAPEAEPELVEVPNTLGAKARGEEVDMHALRKMISEAKLEINEQRLRRNAAEVAALVRAIVPACLEDRLDAETEAKIDSLVALASDVRGRLMQTSFSHVSDLCYELHNIAGSLQEGGRETRSIALLTPLSNAISVSFNPDAKSADFAEQVVAMVRQHIERAA